MLQISIRQLHMKTGDWVRKAAANDGIVLLERGRPVAKIVPFTAADSGTSFAKRPLVEGFSKLPRIENDSTGYISEGRERA